MAWPTTTDYSEAMQNLPTTMGDGELRAGETECNTRGTPLLYVGNFASVFKVVCPQTANVWAVKCFTREVAGLQERYRLISEHLRQVNLPFMVEFTYLERGVLIQGQWWPILKMRWVEGLGLNAFVHQHLDQPSILEQLLGHWPNVAGLLRKAQIAHADLQHGNVLLVPRENRKLQLKLIDYDGMYIPLLRSAHSGELGHESYQHPARIKQNIHSTEVDRFSHLVIYSAIQSLVVAGKPLWERYDNGDNLLFRYRDFERPDESVLFGELWNITVPNVRAATGHLLLATQSPFGVIPHIDELVQGRQLRPLTSDEERQAVRILNGYIHSPGANPLDGKIAEIKRGSRSEAQPESTEALLPQPLPMSEAAEPKPDPAVLFLPQPIPLSIATPEVVPVENPLSVGERIRGLFLHANQKLKTLLGEENQLFHQLMRVWIVGLLLGIVGVLGIFSYNFMIDDSAIEVPSNYIANTNRSEYSRVVVQVTPEMLASMETSLRLAKSASQRADAAFETQFRPLTYKQGIDLIASGIRARDEANLRSAQQQFEEAAKLFKQAEAEAPLVNSIADAENAWNSARIAANKSRLERYSPRGLATAQHLADAAVNKASSQDYSSASEEFRRAVVALAGANREATLAIRLEDAIARGEKSLAVDHLFQLRRSFPEHSRLAQYRDQVNRLPELTVAGKIDGGTPISNPELMPPRIFTAPPVRTIKKMLIPGPESPPIIAAKQVRTFRGHSSGVTSAVFNRFGRQILTGSADSTAITWDTNTGQRIRFFLGHRGAVHAVAFSPDDRQILTGSEDSSAALWIVATGTRSLDLGEHQSAVLSVAISPDGTRVLTGSADRSAMLWEVANRITQSSGRQLDELAGHDNRVTSVAFSSDGERFLTGSLDSAILWDMNTKRSIRTFRSGGLGITSVAISPDNRHVLLGENDRASLWDIELPSQIRAFNGHSERITSVAFRPDGEQVLTGSEDSTAIIWDTATGQQLAVLKEHTDSVTSVVFSWDGRLVLTGSSDKTAILWAVSELLLSQDDKNGPHNPIETLPENSKNQGTLEERVAALQALAKKATPQTVDQLTDQSNEFLDLVQDADTALRYDLVNDALDAAIVVGRLRRDSGARAALMSLSAEREKFKWLQQFSDKIRKNPTDAKANLALGKLLWMHTRNPLVALPHLAKGDDPLLSSLAERDLAVPRVSNEQIALADGWWDAANSKSIPDENFGIRGELKSAVLQRAADLYLLAWASTSGLERTRMEKRLQQVNRFDLRSLLD